CLSFFFLMLPRPTTSTLFPYTTLFRSYLWPWYWLGFLVFFALWTFAERYFGWGSSENGFSPTYNRVVGAGVYVLFQWLTHLVLTDRKSTRLNSSHVAISYAVFCLKKKI